MFTIYDLYRKHEQEIEEFKKNCKHKYDDETSAIEKFIDDTDIKDAEGNIYHYATYEEWEECHICGEQFKIK